MKTVFLSFLLLVGTISFGARIKDMASLKGARDNQLIGYGVVVGLSGSGDKDSELTKNSVGLALKGLGVDVKAPVETKNSAAVLVSAVIPPFSKLGSRLDVTVSSIGTATSLDGGTLMLTSLRGPDGNVYAMAQGKIVTLKRGENTPGTQGQTLVTATVPEGALLEKEVPFDFQNQKVLRYHLNQPDFTTAARMAHRINEELGGKYATANDAASVDIILPYQMEGSPVDVVAQIEGIDVEADRKAKVVINPRTGTVVLGEGIHISPVAIAHGNLKIEITNKPAAQPTGQGEGEEKKPRFRLVQSGTTIADLVSHLNEVGAGPDDMVAMVQALKSAGALLAEVEIR